MTLIGLKDKPSPAEQANTIQHMNRQTTDQSIYTEQTKSNIDIRLETIFPAHVMSGLIKQLLKILYEQSDQAKGCYKTMHRY